MPDGGRESLGSLFHIKELQIYLVSFPLFIFIFIVCGSGSIWEYLYDCNAWAVGGLVISNYTVTLGLEAFIFSWILVDQISWLTRSLIFLSAGFMQVVCSCILLIILFEINTKIFPDFVRSLDDHDEGIKKAQYTQFFLVLNLFEGVFCLIVSTCLCAVLDEANLFRN